MNALANEQVGGYLNEHFVSSFLKVGTFTIANGNKQGGNVATYFCLPDGSVLQAIAGPVDAATMLREARWVVETRKLAIFDSQGSPSRYKEFFRQAHAERLRQYGADPWRTGRGATVNVARKPPTETFPDGSDPVSLARVQTMMSNQVHARNLDNPGKVHLLLANYPLVKVERVYKYVFERVLGEKVSTLPVAQN